MVRSVTLGWARGALLTATILVSGCSSCQQQSEIPQPVSKEGRLPQPPQPAVAAARTPEVPPPACAVVASASTEDGAAPLQVKFSAEGMCTDADGAYNWDFGDGSAPSREQNPAHTYASPGTYTARVSLEDPEHNAKDTDELPITVTAQQP